MNISRRLRALLSWIMTVAMVMSLVPSAALAETIDELEAVEALEAIDDSEVEPDRSADYVVRVVHSTEGSTTQNDYPSLSEAVDEATDDDTVVLLEDITLDESIEIAKNLTLDLNEQTMTIIEGGGLVARGASLTVENGSIEDEGEETDDLIGADGYGSSVLLYNVVATCDTATTLYALDGGKAVVENCNLTCNSLDRVTVAAVGIDEDGHKSEVVVRGEESVVATTNNSALFVSDGGLAILEEGLVWYDNTDGIEGAACVQTGGTFILKGGEVRAGQFQEDGQGNTVLVGKGYGISADLESGTVKVEGGLVRGPHSLAIREESHAILTRGYIDGGFEVKDSGTIDVCGGWFTSKVPDEYVNGAMHATDALDAAPDLDFPFSVAPNESKLEISTVERVIYTGQAQTPEVVVIDKGVVVGTDEQGNDVYRRLVENEDYTLRYENNEAVGRASAIATLQGVYAGELTATFDIVIEKACNVDTNTRYVTLAEALADSSDGETIQLLENASLEAAFTVDCDLTLDLNEKSLLIEASRCLVAAADSSLSIENGTVLGVGEIDDMLVADGGTLLLDGVQVDNAEGATAVAKNGGLLHISYSYLSTENSEKVTIAATGANAEGKASEIIIDGSSTIVHTAGIAATASNGGSITLDDGTIWSPDEMLDYAAVEVSDGGAFVMNDGSVLIGVLDGDDNLTSNGTGISVSGSDSTAEIKGGTVRANESVSASSDATAFVSGGNFEGTIAGNVDVSGGWFDRRVPDECVHEGLKATDALDSAPNEKYPYTVESDVDLSKAEIVVAKRFVYSGAQQGPTADDISVVFEGRVIDPEVGYTLTIEPAVDAGTYEITAEGKGAITGTATGSFDIERCNVENLSVETIDSWYADGTAVEFVSAVKLGDVELPATDYQIVYANNVEAGTAMAFLLGKGNLTGLTLQTFVISQTPDKDALSQASDEAGSLLESLDGLDTYNDPAEIGDDKAVYVGAEALAALEAAQDAAAQVLANTQATPDAIDEATRNLTSATEAAKASIVDQRDFEELQNELATAQELADGLSVSEDGQADSDGNRMEKGDCYVSPEEMAKLEEAIETAREALETLAKDPQATQDDVAEATETLGDAVSAAQSATQAVDRWERIWGQNGYDTMKAVVNTEGVFTSNNTNTVVIASRNRWEDPLAATALAGVYDAPLLLVGKASDGLPTQTKSELARLRPKRVVVVGGTDIVNDATFKAIKTAAGTSNVTRISGKTYIERANAMMRGTVGWQDNTAIIATHNSFRDTLSAAPFAYAQKYPIVFVGNKVSNKEGGKLDASTVKLLKDRGVSKVIIMGGEVAVSRQVERQLGGVECVRWYGKDSLDTSAVIAKHALDDYNMTVEHVSVARADGNNYVDALSGAALTGRLNSVLVLANSQVSLASGTRAFDEIRDRLAGTIVHGHVYGGELAISKSFLDYFDSWQ